MASPATNKRTPDTKISAGSWEMCTTIAGNEPRLSSIATAIAMSVGPIRPAIILDVVIVVPFAASLPSFKAAKQAQSLRLQPRSERQGRAELDQGAGQGQIVSV